MSGPETLGEWAAAYASRERLAIFPVNPTTKEPLATQHQATTDLATLASWWTRWPPALIGCRVSPDELILDIDPRHNGDRTWEALEEHFGPIRVGRRHYSGRGDGGFHAWFVRPAWMKRLSTKALDRWAQEHEVGAPVVEDGVTVRWTSGIDILQHDHRYTILPPSPHPATGKPYYWPESGTNGELVELPEALAHLLVRPEAKEPAPPTNESVPLDALEHGDSIADWVTETMAWGEILCPHGWTLVEGDGDGDGSLWKHPRATTAHSASIKHGCLFVYSPNTHFDVTAPNDTAGYTKFRAWAVLDHSGDLSAAARAARASKNGAPSSNGSAPTGSCNLPDEFWQSRSILTSLRAAAHERMIPADALYGVVRARLCALVPSKVRLDTGILSPVSLNMVTVLVGASGTSKTTTASMGADLVPWGVRKDVYDGPLGTGEGIAELFFEYVPDPNHTGTGRAPKVKMRKDAFAVFLDLDEGETLARLSERSGATIMATLRSAFSGATIGATNAKDENRRIVKAHTYRLSVVVNAQESVAGTLLADTATGSAQRFTFFNVIDPAMRLDAPALAERWAASIPTEVMTGRCSMMTLAPSITKEIRAQRYETQTGKRVLDPLDSQRVANRLKEAAMLALLDGHLVVNEDDWRLAGMVLDTSDALRRRVLVRQRNIDQQVNESRGIAQGIREAAAESERERRLVAEMSKRIDARVDAAGAEGIGRGELRKLVTASKTRHRFDPALDLSVANLHVEVSDGRVRPRS